MSDNQTTDPNSFVPGMQQPPEPPPPMEGGASSGSFTVPGIPPAPQMVVESIPEMPQAPAPAMPPVPNVPPVPAMPEPYLSNVPEAATIPRTGMSNLMSSSSSALQPVITPQEPAMAPFPEMPVSPDNLVIPSAPIGNDSQFVPQGLVSPGNTLPPSGVIPPPPIPQRQGGFGKKLLFLLLFLILIGGIAFGVKFGLGFIDSNKEVTISYWGMWETDAIVAPIIADFESKNPKIKVKYEKQNYRQYRERLQSAVTRGDGPDVFRYHATWIPMLKNEIQPVPADVMSPSEFTSKFYKVASQDLLAGSTLWGIPLEVDGLGLYVNDDLFTTAGVTAPTSYEELLEIVPKLTVKNGNDIVTSAIALGTSNNVENFSDILALMILQNGGKLTEPTGREAEEAFVFYRKFATPTDPMYTWNGLLDNSISAFANGRVAMIFAPSWRAFDIKQLNPNLRFHIETVPQLPGNTISWGSYWVEGVSSKSKNQKQAMAFLKHLTSKESAVKMYTEASKTRLFGEPYALVELGNSIMTDPFVGAYVKQAQNARSFPLASQTHDNGINDRMVKYMEDAINSADQNVAPAQALSTMSQGFRQVLSSYGLTSAAVAP